MAERATGAEFKGSAALWFGVLSGPAAWSAQLVIGSELPEFMCSTGNEGQDVLGFSIESVIVGATALLAAFTVAGLLVSLRCWRATRKRDAATAGRAAWMGAAGIMTNILFLILILPGFFPSLFLTDCGRAL